MVLSKIQFCFYYCFFILWCWIGFFLLFLCASLPVLSFGQNSEFLKKVKELTSSIKQSKSSDMYAGWWGALYFYVYIKSYAALFSGAEWLDLAPWLPMAALLEIHQRNVTIPTLAQSPSRITAIGAYPAHPKTPDDQCSQLTWLWLVSCMQQNWWQG